MAKSTKIKIEEPETKKPIEASNLFHNIMKASVTVKPKKAKNKKAE